MIHRHRKAASMTLAGAIAAALPLMNAQAAEFATTNGWSVSFDGNVSAYYVSASQDKAGGAPSDDASSRIVSGWNPSKFNAHFKAPEFDGLTVSGHFQYATNITGNTASNSPTNPSGQLSQGNANTQNDVRVLDIQFAGDWGTVGIGRSWSIFDGSAIVHDNASGIGLGALCSGSAGNLGGGQCGHLGTGYSWTAFASRVEYDTPDLGGFGARLGVFDPGAPGNGFKTTSPRFEGEFTYGRTFDGGDFKAWLGGMSQRLSAQAPDAASVPTMSAVGVGAHLGIAGFNINANYTSGTGVQWVKFQGYSAGCGGTEECRAAKYKQWYLNADYTFGNTTLGASTGKGRQDFAAASGAFTGFDKTETTLSNLYLHQKLTSQLNLVVEYDRFNDRNATLGVDANKYSYWAVGAWFSF
jgi:hypothetical protein